MQSVGWHPDPADADGERWWDGVAWTEHSRAVVREPQPPAQLGLRQAIPRETLIFASDDRTRLIGWIVSSPFWAGALLVVVSILQDVVLPALTLSLVIAALCLLDRRALRRRGFVRLPSRWWVFLGPIGYLAGRRRALGERDAASLLTCAVGWGVVAVPIFVFSAVRMGLGAAQLG